MATLIKPSAIDSRNPAGLDAHRTFTALFRPGELTIGVFTAIEAYPGESPTMRDHGEMAKLAEDAGFGALWLRDVPFRDPGFGDVGQIYDPFVYAGWLAAATRRIAIGTAGVVLPLRDPLAVAKQATSVDQLSGGRMILGLATGDRPTEYPAFGRNFENRVERFRDALELIRVATGEPFPVHAARYYGALDGSLDLVPKPADVRLPVIAIGRGGQTIEWMAEHLDGWLWHQTDFKRLPGVVAGWREATGPGLFKPYGYGHLLDLQSDPDAPMEIGRGLRMGRKALIELWKRQRDFGVNHVAINLKISQRPAHEVVAEFGSDILPHF